jgi:hypothetical protein
MEISKYFAFSGQSMELWRDLRELVGRCARMLRDWRVLQKPEDVAVLDVWSQEQERRRSRPAELTWELLRDQEAALAPNVGDASQLGEGFELSMPDVCNNVNSSEPIGRSSHVECAG